ncbi:response regulator [Vulgatibacter incomptus]|uniref:DNA-binding response regulator, LuxR family n=1 Tax=Vulgatibacter incomptus TaxID=1391653 RepID=A0A0K1PF76_9BACT|nr:response regulator transcription factor [Vulgatibacter incomptus]AKU91754.1 DNA-binding response regulator, LuxR family [Vulgatibacter incomptus]
MSDPIRVLVVEDQPKILEPLLKLLGGFPTVSIVGAARSGEEALEEAARLRPQVVLCDLGLPGISGIDVTRVLKSRPEPTEVLVFTVFEEEEKVLAAIQAGASGYLLKGAPAAKVVEAIEEVHAGGTVIQPSLARKLLGHFRAPVDEPAPPPANEEGPNLSPRETEILQLIAKGLTNPEVAEILSLSRSTIRTHLEHIYMKLEVTNRVEAVTEGLRKRLIEA